LDTETTGLNPHADRVVWIAADLLDDNATMVQTGQIVIAEVQHQSYFGTPPPDIPRATRRQALQWLLGWIDWAGCFLAHNASFDERMLRAEFEAEGLAFPDVPIICTMRLAQHIELPSDSWKLDDVAAAVGWNLTDGHRADHDTRAATAILINLLPQLEREGITTHAGLAARSRSGRSGWSGKPSPRRQESQAMVFPLFGERRTGSRPRLEWGDHTDDDVSAVHRAAHAEVKATTGFLSDATHEQVLAALKFLTAVGCSQAPNQWRSYVYGVGGRSWRMRIEYARDALDALRDAGCPDRDVVDGILARTSDELWDKVKPTAKQNYFELMLPLLENYSPWIDILPVCERCTTEGTSCWHGGMRAYLRRLLPALQGEDGRRMRDTASEFVDPTLALLIDRAPDFWAEVIATLASYEESEGTIEEALRLWGLLVERDMAGAGVYDRMSLHAERARHFDYAAHLAGIGAEMMKPISEERLALGMATVPDPLIARLEKRAERCRTKAVRKASAKPAPSTAAANRPASALVRQWAGRNGIDVPERGRLPTAVYKAYADAHPES
jgi:DNA polymerase III epsilon subunit-like protein